MNTPARSLADLPVYSEVRETIDLDSNRRLLNRYRYLEQTVMRTLAGWLAKVSRYELKCEIGRVIWEDSQHVDALYLRLREIQSPAFQKPADPAFLHLIDELKHAPDEFALAVGIWRVVKPRLAEALAVHEKATFPNSDRPSVYAIEHMGYDVRAQCVRMELLLRGWESEGRFGPAVAVWQNYITGLLRDAGGIGGEEPRPASPTIISPVRREFVPPREAARDERFTNLGVVAGIWGETPPEADYERHSSWEFERYSTEILAAETIGLVMYLMPGMSWEFHFDLARHLYDEVRHGMMGYEWMRLNGTDPFVAPQSLAVFQWRSQFTPLEQYCLLTMGNEANVFPYRLRRVEAHRQGGNRLNEQFVRYDMADETQHVRFGKRWLPEMVKFTGEKRSTDDFVADVLKVWHAEYTTGKFPIQAE